MQYDPRAMDYVARRTAEGMSTNVMRCLKRFVAREVYRHITHRRPGPGTGHVNEAIRSSKVGAQVRPGMPVRRDA